MIVLIGVLQSLAAIGVVAVLFFTFYFVAYEPYRAMYPDLLDDEEVAGRAQSTQALARGLGTGFALLGGGLLLSVAKPLPPGSTIGILGGGQLGRMTALAAARLGYRCVVYAPEEHSIGGKKKPVQDGRRQAIVNAVTENTGGR